jgi:hypothetical protein
MSWSGEISCFKTNPIDCTLLARWDEGYTDPWLILTNFPPQQSDVTWYSLRYQSQPTNSMLTSLVGRVPLAHFVTHQY